MDTYTEAHLIVAAIRIHQHLKGSPPTIKEVCSSLQISEELGHSIARELKKQNILNVLEDPFSIKLTVANHLAIENIPRKVSEKNSLQDELLKFQEQRKDLDQHAKNIQAEMERKKKAVFADIEEKFKKEMKKNSSK